MTINIPFLANSSGESFLDLLSFARRERASAACRSSSSTKLAFRSRSRWTGMISFSSMSIWVSLIRSEIPSARRDECFFLFCDWKLTSNRTASVHQTCLWLFETNLARLLVVRNINIFWRIPISKQYKQLKKQRTCVIYTEERFVDSHRLLLFLAPDFSRYYCRS